jgi:D-sedoheptulose 7-phosphate isomerase
MDAKDVFDDHQQVMTRAARDLAGVLDEAARALIAALGHGNKILACGNGGSAADAQHLVAEVVCRYLDDRPALPAIALSSDASTFSAIGNDYGYERVFARQVEAFAVPGDVLIAISTSGRSANVLAAAREARSRGCQVIALTGQSGGDLAESADLVLAAPSTVTARIQEVHGVCIHVLAQAIEEAVRSGRLSRS